MASTKNFRVPPDAKGIVGGRGADAGDAEGVFGDDVLVGLGVVGGVGDIPAECGEKRVNKLLPDLGLLAVGLEVGIEVAAEGLDALKDALRDGHGASRGEQRARLSGASAGFSFAGRAPKVAGMDAAIELKQLMLQEPRLMLAVAESLTAGHLQARVAAVSGASDFFLGGVTAYALELKVRLLGVDRAAAKKVNSVSAEVAEQMARGVCELFDSDFGVATTGYAEPSPADGVAVPFAWWAVAHWQRGGNFLVRHGRVECPGATRIDAQKIVAEAAVAELVAYLREQRG